MSLLVGSLSPSLQTYRLRTKTRKKIFNYNYLFIDCIQRKKFLLCCAQYSNHLQVFVIKQILVMLFSCNNRRMILISIDKPTRIILKNKSICICKVMNSNSFNYRHVRLPIHGRSGSLTRAKIEICA